MEDPKDVFPIGSLIGMTVLSRTTGNKLGKIEDILVDPLSGLFAGLTLETTEGPKAVEYNGIYSFGADALMTHSDDSVVSLGPEWLDRAIPAKGQAIGTEIVTEGGLVLGQIANVLLHLSMPPFAIYEVRTSILDRLLGRSLFIYASASCAISKDAARIVVANETAETAAQDVTALLSERDPIEIAWIDKGGEPDTLVRARDEDETLVRLPRSGDS